VDGIENLEGIEGLFEDMRKGRHFGTLVVRIKGDGKEYSGGVSWELGAVDMGF